MKLKQLLREGYTAYPLSDKVRADLAKRFPPKFPDFIGHHITHVFPVSPHEESPFPLGTPATVKVIGHAEEDGLEALVVTVDGKAKRDDTKPYHITWSLDRSKGKRPVQSNQLVARGFTPVEPYEFTTELRFFN